MKTELPSSYAWRGIELKRVIYKETRGSAFDPFGECRTVERPSDPPVFSGTVGMWRYSIELQSDGSWVGKIHIGGASNIVVPPYSDPFLALDFAAAWWRAAVDAIPSFDGQATATVGAG